MKYVLLIASFLLAGFAPTAQAAQADPVPAIVAYKLPIVKIDKRGEDAANRVCPKDTEKMFVVKAFTAGKFYHKQPGYVRLTLVTGEKVKDPGYPVPPSYQENDFFAMPESPSRKAKVNPEGKNFVVVVLEAEPPSEVRLGKLKSTCLEQFGGGEV